MDDVVFETVKLIVMIVAVLFARYTIPAIKSFTNSTQFTTAEKIITEAVLYAQQVMKANTGEEKKTAVTEIVQKALSSAKITISDEQISVLIEAAVKTMKMTEGKSSDETGTEVDS